MKHIYFSHAIADYNTDYENQCIELIKKTYPDCVIHNPKDLDKILKENYVILGTEFAKFRAYFIPEINKCDILIAAPVFNKENKKGEFLSGTQKEITYALDKGKDVKIIMNNEICDLYEVM